MFGIRSPHQDAKLPNDMAMSIFEYSNNQASFTFDLETFKQYGGKQKGKMNVGVGRSITQL